MLKVRAKAAPIQEGDTAVTYVPVPGPKTSVIRDFEGSKCQTMADVWDWSVRRYFSQSIDDDCKHFVGIQTSDFSAPEMCWVKKTRFNPTGRCLRNLSWAITGG